MWKLIWHFFLSFTIRAVFTIALVGGVYFLAWTYQSSRTDDWKYKPYDVRLSFALAGVTTLVGLLGTFRRGKEETNFSVFALAGIVAGVSTGHVYVPTGHAGGGILRRFPSIESFLLGGFLIALWGLVALWKEETLQLRIGAIVGGLQIGWGLAVERLSATSRARVR